MKQEKEAKPTYFVQALDRAMDILECFSYEENELTLNQIIERTGLNRTTVRRLLGHLVDREYMRYDEHERIYYLGVKLLELGGIVFSTVSLRRIAAPFLTRLRDQTGHTVILGVRMEDSLVYADKRDGKGHYRTTSEVGWRRPIHYGGLGMLLMAYMTEEKQDEILDKEPLQTFTPKSIVDRNIFKKELKKIRNQGFMVGREYVFEGLGGIGAPIKDYRGDVVASLLVTMPISFINDPEIEAEIIKNAKDAAEEISRNLGYSGS